MTAEPIPIKPANEYTPAERIMLIREARIYMIEVSKRMERLYELEQQLELAGEEHDVSSEKS